MKRSVCEAFAIILSKELAVTQLDVIDLIARTATIHPLPLLGRLLSFPAFSPETKPNIHTWEESVNMIHRYNRHAMYLTNSEQ